MGSGRAPHRRDDESILSIRLIVDSIAPDWRTQAGPGTIRFPAPLVTGMGALC
jgi:hypothetical protein